MFEAWLHFAIVTSVQLLLFIIHAYYEKRLSDAPRILGRGVLIGVVIGLFFDLVLGKFLELFSYTLGFGVLFITLNLVFSYGLFSANTLLMQRARLLHLYLWTIIVMVVYEITNLFFPMWTWKLALPDIAFLAVLSVGYFGGAILVAIISHVFLRDRFLFIDTLLKR